MSRIIHQSDTKNGAEETLNKIDRLEECQPLGIYKSPANDMLCVVKFFYSVIR